MFIKNIIKCAVVISVLGLAMCSSNQEYKKKNDTKVASIYIEPESASVNVGESVEFTVKGYNKSGQRVSLSGVPEWKVFSGNAYGTLDKSLGEKVKFTGKQPGKTVIDVSSGTLTKTVGIKVVKKAAQPPVKTNKTRK